MNWALDDTIIVKLAGHDYGTVVIYFLKFITFNLDISLFQKKHCLLCICLTEVPRYHF